MTISVVTDYPIAVDSVDHQHPLGTMQDNSTSPAFNRKLFALGRPVRLLDLGCSGGGLVKSILDDGGFAVGIEGSDYSRQHQRAEWATIPDHLFTADATKPFALVEARTIPLKFNVITAWEFMEHIAEEDQPTLFENIHRHITDDGMLIVSIATVADTTGGHCYHPTVKPADWWVRRLRYFGFALDERLTRLFAPDWVRGPVTGEAQSLCGVFRQ